MYGDSFLHGVTYNGRDTTTPAIKNMARLGIGRDNIRSKGKTHPRPLAADFAFTPFANPLFGLSSTSYLRGLSSSSSYLLFGSSIYQRLRHTRLFRGECNAFSSSLSYEQYGTSGRFHSDQCRPRVRPRTARSILLLCSRKATGPGSRTY